MERVFYQMLLETTTLNEKGETVTVPSGTVMYYDPGNPLQDASVELLVRMGDAKKLTRVEALGILRKQLGEAN